MMDWLVRPLATMFFGGALGGSSGNINLEVTDAEGREVSAGCAGRSRVFFSLGPEPTRLLRPGDG